MLVGVGKLSVFNFKWQVYPKVGFLPINLFRFFIVIVDIFSPFPILNESNDPVHEKRCGFLITCLITQSGQIELTFSLSADSFIYSICRFVSRRGYTRGNKSDRGRCFFGAIKNPNEFITIPNSTDIAFFHSVTEDFKYSVICSKTLTDEIRLTVFAQV